MNASAIDPARDMGGDDGSTVAEDVFAYSLSYYQDDYQNIGGSNVNPEFGYTGTDFSNESSNPSLYNGNIRHMTVQHQAPNSASHNLNPARAYVYQYDQLHRIQQMRQWDYGITTNWNVVNVDATKMDYATDYTYDGNGNVLTLDRYDEAGAIMDEMSYTYSTETNKLRRVNDPHDKDNFEDITDQGNSSNYLYDGVGNITRDFQSNTVIRWTPYGKVKQIEDDQNGFAISTKYGYGPDQNRYSKWRAGSKPFTDYYVRDAQGNIMAVYTLDEGTNPNATDDKLFWKEQHLYGSSRLGLIEFSSQRIDNISPNSPIFSSSTALAGDRRYELVGYPLVVTGE